jgi:endoglycosylceramidase
MFEFWKVVVTRFKGNKNVIGYDIMNEPWTANMYKDITLFLDTQKFDRTKLFPFHQRADKVVRDIDPSAIIFFSPC